MHQGFCSPKAGFQHGTVSSFRMAAVAQQITIWIVLCCCWSVEALYANVRAAANAPWPKVWLSPGAGPAKGTCQRFIRPWVPGGGQSAEVAAASSASLWDRLFCRAFSSAVTDTRRIGLSLWLTAPCTLALCLWAVLNAAFTLFNKFTELGKVFCVSLDWQNLASLCYLGDD